jgi:magnesium-transporting ATPase (P-type)
MSFFITLSIIVFGFYPITALMIVLLAILNDLPIMTIAYDNVKYSNDPEKWNMGTLLGIATFLGIVGVISSFGLLYIGRDVFNLSPTILQSFIYLKLSVAGHLTLFVARTKGPFGSIHPGTPVSRGYWNATNRYYTYSLRNLITGHGLGFRSLCMGLCSSRICDHRLLKSPVLSPTEQQRYNI